MNALWASAATPTAEATTAEYRLQGFFPNKHYPPPAPARTHRTKRFSCPHPPILMSFSRSVVRLQCLAGFGSASWRRKFARLYARGNNCKRAALSLKRRHDSFVHFTAFFPSFIHCSAVPLQHRVGLEADDVAE